MSISGETGVRINRLENINLLNINRDWFVETDQPIENEEIETNRISYDEIFNIFVASNSEYGSVKIGNESEIRNTTEFDHENMLSGNMLRKLFNKTYNFNNNDIVGTNTNNVNIFYWDTAAVGNMIWHNGKFRATTSIASPNIVIKFKNVSPNPLLGKYFLADCVYANIDNITNLTKVPAWVYGDSNYTYLFVDTPAPGIINDTKDYYINGWYFRER